MTEADIIKLARVNETSNPFLTDFKLSKDALLAFARAIENKAMDEQREKHLELILTYPAPIADAIAVAIRRANKE